MKMKDGCFAMLFVAVAMACSSYAVAQAAKHEPDFTLTISTDDQTVVSQKDMEVSVNVEEGNISNHPINAGRPNEPGTWYKMIVLRDGSPAPMTERYRKLVTPEKEDPNVPETADGALWTIKPGQTQMFEVPLAAFFDLSAPGEYKITFSRGTDPGQPDSVDVESNTITVTILPPGSTQPAQG
jgi:hypothetical protein